MLPAQNRIGGGENAKAAKFARVSTRLLAMFGFLRLGCGIYRTLGINLEYIWQCLAFWPENEGGVACKRTLDGDLRRQ
jgi:hypothetical protein